MLLKSFLLKSFKIFIFLPHGPCPVSYTHLDVYKRQIKKCGKIHHLVEFYACSFTCWLKGSPDGPAHKGELMQLIHNVVACIIRHTVAQVFKIANLFQDS